jgi:Flp pilus assembly protein TadG
MSATGRSARKGQAMAELALAIPVLLLTIVALLEGAGFVFALSSLQNAAQEGGRLAALPTTATESAVRDRIVVRAAPFDVDASDVTIAVNSGTRTFLLRQSGDRIRVDVGLDYSPFTSVLFGGSTIAISVAAEYRVE